MDRRYQKGFPGDIESPQRLIEVKSTATSYRGWFLPMQPVQVEHARTDPAFRVYVVEHIGSGRDPSKFTLRILAGEHLRRLAEAAVARTSYEVPWPIVDYDATAIEGAPRPVVTPEATRAEKPSTSSLGPASEVATGSPPRFAARAEKRASAISRRRWRRLIQAGGTP